jgi:HK97 family phage portal protein
VNPFQKALRLATERKNVSAAQLLPSYKVGQPMDKEWDVDRALRDGYRACSTVFSCIDRRAKAIAALPWYVEQKMGDDEYERVVGHPLEYLLNVQPNEFMTRHAMFTRIVEHLDIDGNAIVTKLMVGSEVKELWPLQTRPLRVIPSRAKFIEAYEYRDGEVIRRIPSEAVIHFMIQDPGNPYWGMAPMRAASKEIDTAVQAIAWNRKIFDTNIRPDLLFTINAPLNREQAEQAAHEIESLYAGAENAHRPIVVGNGATAEVINWKPTEMDYTESLHYYREQIAQVYGVPLPVLGILESATLANLQDSRRIFWEDTILPLADNIKAGLNQSLLEPDGEFRICYDTSGIPALREDMTAKTTQLKDMVGVGVPLNEALKRLEMDIEDVEGGDIGFIPATWVPLPQAVDMAEQQLRMGDATIDNTEASTETTLKPVPPAKDPNKPKPAVPKGEDEPVEVKAPPPPAVDVRIMIDPAVQPSPTGKSMRVRPVRSPSGKVMEYEVTQDITYTDQEK